MPQSAAQQINPASLALDQVRHAYFVLDDEFRCVFINREAERLIGRNRDTLLNRRVWEMYPDILGTRVEHEYRRAASERVYVSFENYYAAFDRWYSMEISPIDHGIIVGFRDITTEKLLEEEVEKSRDILDSVSASGLIGSFRWSIPDDELVISSEIYELCGLAPGEEKRDSSFWKECLHPDDQEVFAARLRTCFAERISMLTCDFRTRQRQGKWRWVHCRAKISYGIHGEPLRMVGINVDATKQKALEQQLQERVEELETVMEVAPIPIWVASDPECRTILGNRAANEFYEAQAGENVSATTVMGRRFFRNGVEINPDELPMQKAASQNVTVRDSELSVMLPSGITRNVISHASPLRDVNGKVRGAVGAFIDITDVKRAEDELRSQRAQLEATFQALQDGVVVFDLERNPVLINDAAAKIAGVDTPEELKRSLLWLRDNVELRTVAGVVVPVEDWPAVRAMRGERFSNVELIAKRLDSGKEWFFSYGGGPIFNAAGEQILAVAIARDITEEKRMAAALIESETRYRMLVQNCPVGLAIYGITGLNRGRLSLVNEAYLRIIGYTREDFDAGQLRWDTITPPEWVAADTAAIRELLDKGVAQPFEKEYVKKDGRRVPVLIATAAMPGSDEVAAFVLDLTELRQAQRALEERGAELARKVKDFETLFSVAPVGMAMSYDPACDDIRVNPSFARLLGVNTDENASLNSPNRDRLPFRMRQHGRELPPDELPQQMASRTGEPQGPTELEIVRDDGERFLLFGTAIPLFEKDGTVRGTIGTYFDATELRAADVKLRASHAQLRRLVDSNIVGVAIADEQHVFEANELYLDMLGCSRDDLREGRVDWTKATPPEFLARDMAALQELRERGSCAPFEKEYIRTDGTHVPILLAAAALATEPLTWICLVVDLTEQKSLERELQSANRRLAHSNEELQSFAYVAAHDLKSPLRTISAMTTLLSRRMEGHLDSVSKELASHVESSVRQMNALISDLLEYSKIVSGTGPGTKPVDCGAIFAWAVENLDLQIREMDAKISADPLPIVQADSQLVRVFQNLIDNALKYRSERRPEIHVTAKRSGDDWVISVRDNGIGLDMQYSERIFGVFQRLHGAEQHDGTGIGLAICRRLIERYGGRMWVESELGVGSTFFFSLPGAG